MSGQVVIISKVPKDSEDCRGLALDGSSNLEDLLAVSRLSFPPIQNSFTWYGGLNVHK